MQNVKVIRNRLLFIVILLSFSSCEIFLDDARKIPPDDYFEKMFRSSKNDFERLVQMSNEDDKVLRVSSDFTIVEGSGLSNQSGQLGFSSERWETYKALFKKLDIQGGINRGKNGSVEFLAYGRGLGVSGISNGYLFSELKEDCPWTSLDSKEAIREKAFACKKIAENGYLFVAR